MPSVRQYSQARGNDLTPFEGLRIVQGPYMDVIASRTIHDPRDNFSMQVRDHLLTEFWFRGLEHQIHLEAIEIRGSA